MKDPLFDYSRALEIQLIHSDSWCWLVMIIYSDSWCWLVMIIYSDWFILIHVGHLFWLIHSDPCWSSILIDSFWSMMLINHDHLFWLIHAYDSWCWFMHTIHSDDQSWSFIPMYEFDSKNEMHSWSKLMRFIHDVNRFHVNDLQLITSFFTLNS